MPIPRLTLSAREQAASETGPPYVEVTVTDQDTGNVITFLVHESTIYPGVVNVEVDGEVANPGASDGTGTGLRIHMNDHLILDSHAGIPEITDLRD